MKRIVLNLLLLSLLLLNIRCNNNKNRSESPRESEQYYSEKNQYEDGTYCANVTYHNPNTGTRNTYKLEVEVEANELVKIYWSNGGWLDEDHFNAQEINSNGTCSFTSDKGYEYDIEIIEENCDYTDKFTFQNDLEEEKKQITCPSCGDEKDIYDDYCNKCQDKVEHTCKRCGQVDIFMFPTDEYCSDCVSQF